MPWKSSGNSIPEEPLELGKPISRSFPGYCHRVLERMTHRLASDYRELQEYTEHTTHELQTPLAVIKSKTELLMQSTRLGEEEMSLLQSILHSTGQLSRLNAALTLLTRIENRQFPGRKALRAGVLFDRHLENLTELIDMRRIHVHKGKWDEHTTLVMDEGLADILVANLLKNAVLHNREGGRLELDIREHRLEIRNEGEPLRFSEQDLFLRFVRDKGKSGNLGLGLSIVKKICETYGYEISYAYDSGYHRFSIHLQKEES
ncbi:MAG: HAMP domain-containing sensor histidine kinase [Bacteroidales bacterium]